MGEGVGMQVSQMHREFVRRQNGVRGIVNEQRELKQLKKTVRLLHEENKTLKLDCETSRRNSEILTNDVEALRKMMQMLQSQMGVLMALIPQVARPRGLSEGRVRPNSIYPMEAVLERVDAAETKNDDDDDE